MAQVHLDSHIVRRIIDNKQTALVYPAPLNVEVGDEIVVREPYVLLGDGSILYRADTTELRKYKWRPSIFLKSEHARLFLEVIYSENKRISELSDEDVQNLGHETRESFHREWNSDLAKDKRNTLGVRLDPEIVFVKFSVKKS